MLTKVVEFSNINQMKEVFGPFDSNIKEIEKTTGVMITGNEHSIKITGEENKVLQAERAVEALMAMHDGGHHINALVLNQTLELAEDGDAKDAVSVMKDVLTMTHKGKPIRCKTIGQKNYIKAIKEHTITICIGPAGTGKTYLATAMAVDALKNEEISRIILTRPAVEAGEHLGFLPGDLQSKVDPYLRPLYDGLFEMLGEEKFNRALERGIIEVAPLAYMRGRTLSNSWILLDESQNASLEQLLMVLTRLGEGSKIIVTGDITQVDLKDNASGLEKCANILSGIDDIAVIRLNNRDVVRHKLVKDIIKAFEKYQSENKPENPAPNKGSYRKNNRGGTRR